MKVSLLNKVLDLVLQVVTFFCVVLVFLVEPTLFLLSRPPGLVLIELGDLRSPLSRIWRKTYVRVELRGISGGLGDGSSGLSILLLGGSSLPWVRPRSNATVGLKRELARKLSSNSLANCSTDVLATSGPSFSAKMLVELGVMAKESARLGSSRVRKLVHVNREWGIWLNSGSTFREFRSRVDSLGFT
ncbi:hypothetical protein GW17_00020012 [Ensete ventricosum]|nr:hypothetical protein GW17_00020012 [Ensete ventricosum]